MPRRSCIVIGGGLAGLAAAHRLTQHGWKVDVLEAQGRMGGRVMSYTFDEAPELVCELGAEWIGSDHTAIKSLCRQFDLPLQNHQYAFRFWHGESHGSSRVFRPGAWSFSATAKRRFRAFAERFKGFDLREQQELDQCDWWTILQGLGFSLRELADRDLMDSTDFGESIRLSSAYLAATEYICSNKTDEMDFKIRGGNSLLIDALVDFIKSRNRLHKRISVTDVGQNFDRVQVYAKGRIAPYEAQFCICTVPAHCLTRIRWSPDLPLDQHNAASQLQYSRIMKTAVLYTDRFWPTFTRDGFSVFTSRVSDFCFDSSFRQAGRRGILCSYAIGDKADDLAAEPDETNVTKWITEDVARVVSAHSPVEVAPIAVKRQAWQREPWIGGAYAFYRPGQWFTVRPVLGRPHGRVLFAGEHLSEEWQGFMEGAVQTGQAAADRLLKFAP